jgi:RimJ/RimL family protein N-acetyltransferase
LSQASSRGLPNDSGRQSAAKVIRRDVLYTVIKGEKTYLTELDRNNTEIIRGWLNDPEVHEFLAVGRVPITREAEEHYYDLQLAAGDRHTFEVHVGEDGRYIGNVGLKDINLVHRRAELGVVIGSKEDWGQGYGADAIVACLRFAFDTLGLHSVRLKAHSDHVRGLALYRSLGFIETGREREAVFQDGCFADYVVLDILDREFRDRHNSY